MTRIAKEEFELREIIKQSIKGGNLHKMLNIIIHEIPKYMSIDDFESFKKKIQQY